MCRRSNPSRFRNEFLLAVRAMESKLLPTKL